MPIVVANAQDIDNPSAHLMAEFANSVNSIYIDVHLCAAENNRNIKRRDISTKCIFVNPDIWRVEATNWRQNIIPFQILSKG